ncbi:pyruvate/2-oxoglutarate dehydrogenase complex dihydrolipoamide acyltransferase (E2) component [Pseudonocardia eucalypti]|nr:pyruvate/2-oxoglutarate dehydrogenase complex dihydrolipoamide acyltransferase (E2) component [Pseudonocardia eucalypti]
MAMPQRAHVRAKRLVRKLAKELGAELADVTASRPDATVTVPTSSGAREVPQHAYYSVQPLRAVENFAISSLRPNQFADLVTALAYVKKALGKIHIWLTFFGFHPPTGSPR